MDQPEEILEKLERFNVQKNPEIPRELDEYVSFVARTGDSVFAWPLVKNLYREKLINVITEFYNEQPTKELPTYPNVDPFNYDTMKKTLIERLDSFIAAPFTIQRISELLSDPRKQYSRIDKFMRAVEKNILVVSTVAPGRHRSEESENGDSLDSALNGEFSSDVHVDIDMDNDGSFSMTKEFNATTHRKEENHEIVAANHETITIKKNASKEEEASTSAIAVDIITGEPPQGTQTEVSVETQSTVTITVCEPDIKPVTLEKSKETSETSSIVENKEEAVSKSESSIIPEIIDPKIEEALLNEPLRPADDEILVDTSDLISTATTPLAALENIVAIRTDPSLIEAVESPRSIIEQTTSSSNIEISQKEESLLEQKNTTGETEKCNDDEEEEEEVSATEAKRLKIEEVDNIKPEEVPQIASESNKEDIKESVEEQAKEEEKEKVLLEEEKNPEESEKPLVDASVHVEQEVIEGEANPSVLEITPIIEEPIAAERIEETETPIEEEVAVPVITEMETLPSVAENTMSLDEDEPPTIAEMDTAPAAPPPAANKMDMDENEAETALMDVDDEPMDQ